MADYLNPPVCDYRAFDSFGVAQKGHAPDTPEDRAVIPSGERGARATVPVGRASLGESVNLASLASGQQIGALRTAQCCMDHVTGKEQFPPIGLVTDVILLKKGKGWA